MPGFWNGVLIGAAIGAVGLVAVALLVPPGPGRGVQTEAPVEDPTATPDPEAGTDQAEAVAVEPEAEGAAPDDVAPLAPAAEETPSRAEADDATADPPEPVAEIAPEARALAAERSAAAGEPLPDPAEDAVAEAAEPTAGAADAPAPAAEVPAADEDADATGAPAWQRYAAAFPAPEGRALYAVILIDAPADASAEAALLALPAPVTVALDPADPDAPRRATAYRSAGHEVAILASEGEDGDVLAGALAALPEAVAWILPPNMDPTIGAAAEEAGLVVVRPRADAEALPDEAGPQAWIIDEIAPDAARIVVIARLDRVARLGGELGVVAALVGPAANPAMLEALMQRAGREGPVPAAPAPVTAAVEASR
jgi:uncharacterized protein